MKYFLDTNTCIYFLKGTYDSVRTRLPEKHPDEIRVCSIVKAELLCSAEKSAKQEENLKKIEEFLFPFSIVPNDLFIAATVRAHEGCLVTNSVGEFGRVGWLRMENWADVR